jgi:type I site-specific restriction-modification system R (restriction) subunit
MNLPHVKKVVFVVDRKDLDYQTTKEFNSFSKGCIDGTDNTKQLVKQFADDTKLIVTTIQKLNTAISKKQYLAKMESYRTNALFSFLTSATVHNLEKHITGSSPFSTTYKCLALPVRPFLLIMP